MAVTTLDQRMLGLNTTLTDHTIVAGDIISFADSGASNVIKRDTVQGVLDLVPAASAGWEFLEKVTASTSATIDLGDDSNVVAGYDYIITASNVVFPGNVTTAFVLQYGTGSTPTYQTASYMSIGTYTIGTDEVTAALSSQAGINFENATIAIAGTLTINAIIYSPATNAATRAEVSMFGGHNVVTTGVGAHSWMVGERSVAEVVTSFRIQQSGTNITSGDFSLCRRKIA